MSSGFSDRLKTSFWDGILTLIFMDRVLEMISLLQHFFISNATRKTLVSEYMFS